MARKVAIVTGSGQGIGRSCAERLAGDGRSVVLADVKIDVAEKAAAEIAAKYGVETMAFQTDVADVDSVKAMVAATLERFGTVDVLVNNAGIFRLGKPFEEIGNDEWSLLFSVNVLGCVNCIKAVTPTMKAKRGGRIINMASGAAYSGGVAASPTYASSKAAVVCLTKSLAHQLGPYNITANSVAPGLIDTEMTKICGYDPATVPMKTLGTPEQVGDVVAFLAGDRTSYVTGMQLDVNGGTIMR